MFTRNLEISEFAPSAPASPLARVRTRRHPDRFEMNVATAYHDRPDILDAWNRMLATATGPETLYQSPQFFNYLTDMDQGQGAAHELFIVRRRVDYEIVGFVPVRTITCDLAFRLGPVSLFKRTVRACQILGSVPLLDETQDGIADFVIQQLLERYAECQVLYMQAYPEDEGAKLQDIAGVSAYVRYGWRPCHTQPLPKGVDAYLQKFSSKKRYNLSRQVRLLAEAAGAVQVLRIEQPGHVPAMLDALIATGACPGAERGAEQARLEGLARHGLLLSYVIRCGDEDVAVVYGSRSAAVWHVYKIACLQKYLHLSVGTSAIHLAVQDVLAHFAFKDIDFGYGTPSAEFRSTHVLKTRGLVLLHRARSLTALSLKVHGMYDAMNGALIRQVKRAQKWHAQRRQATKKPSPRADAAPTVS